MVTIHLFGRIMPAVIKHWRFRTPVIQFEAGTVEHFAVVIRVRSSNIDAECTIYHWPHPNMRRVHTTVYSLCRSIGDLISFATGYGLAVVVDESTDHMGMVRPLLIKDPDVSAMSTAYDVNNMRPVIDIVLSDWELAHTIHDYAATYLDSSTTGVNCGRVVESVRHLLAPGEPKMSAWKKMHDTLNLDKAYLTLITDGSQAPRHGDRRTTLPDDEVGEILRRTATVLNRYLEFRKRGGSVPLPLDEFPLLQG